MSMKKKVLIVSASPRRNGNSDTLCNQFLKGAVESGHEVEKIFLKDSTLSLLALSSFVASLIAFVASFNAFVNSDTSLTFSLLVSFQYNYQHHYIHCDQQQISYYSKHTSRLLSLDIFLFNVYYYFYGGAGNSPNPLIDQSIY